jgi:hypothetical protein
LTKSAFNNWTWQHDGKQTGHFRNIFRVLFSIFRVLHYMTINQVVWSSTEERLHQLSLQQQLYVKVFNKRQTAAIHTCYINLIYSFVTNNSRVSCKHLLRLEGAYSSKIAIQVLNTANTSMLR